MEDGRFEIHQVKPSLIHLTGGERDRFDRIEQTLRSLEISFRLDGSGFSYDQDYFPKWSY